MELNFWIDKLVLIGPSRSHPIKEKEREEEIDREYIKYADINLSYVA